MESFLAGMAVMLALITAVSLLYLVFVRKTVQPSEGDDVQEWPASEAARPRTPESLNAFWTNRHPGEDGRAQWNEAGGERARQEPQYRARTRSPADSGPRWNPFDPQWGQAARARAARRRPRRIHRAARGEYYALLGVEPDATDQQIERAYRKRVSEIHPDRFYDDPARKREAERRLKELNAAIQVLRDPLLRAKYDGSL